MATKRKPKSTRGGRRQGAGRKPSPATVEALKRADALIDAAPKCVRERVDAIIATNAITITESLIRLAHGGYQREKQWLVPAALVTIERVKTIRQDDGTITAATDANGKPIKERAPAFPDLKPDQLVPVKTQTETADGDREAAKYCLDRVLGKPTQAVELTGAGGGPIDVKSEDMARAAEELAAWRKAMTDALSSGPSAPQTPGTSRIATE